MHRRKETLFYGAATALITPFREGELDLLAFGDLIERQIQAGIDALLVAGTTGESSTLTAEEHHTLIRFAKERIRGRVPLIAGCGSNSTSHALSLADSACQAGADALLAVTPYYNKASDKGLLLHYTALADRATRPLILYSVPSRTGVRMNLATYRSLAEHPNVVAVKEASGDLDLLERLSSECEGRLTVYTGNDTQILSAMKLGAKGVISVYSNLYPERVVELCRLFTSGKVRLAEERMRGLLPRMNALFWEVNPIPVKYLASRMGFCAPEYRLPLCPPDEGTCERLDAMFGEEFCGGTS